MPACSGSRSAWTALDDAVFRRMNDVDFPVADVLDGIDGRAARSGSGRSRSTWWSSAAPTTTRSCRWRAISAAAGVVLRFIEYMDVGATQRLAHGRGAAIGRGAAPDPAPHCRLVAARRRAQPGETAERWRYADGGGEIGVISSVTQAFCRDCNRARLSTEGKLFLCLFATRGHDLRALLRGGATDAQTAARHRR